MAHAPSTLDRPAPQSAASAWVTLDVGSLDQSCLFYTRTLGYAVVATHRHGAIYEERRLVAPGRALGLVLRQSFGIRVVGSGPGHLLRLSLHTTDLPADVARLDGLVTWVGPRPTPNDPASQEPALARFLDPDGYQIELCAADPGWSAARLRA